MKRFVNGIETELSESGVGDVFELPDRLVVRTSEGAFSAVAVRVGGRVEVSYQGRTFRIERIARARSNRAAESGEIRAPMPGQIVEVMVREGDQVSAGQKLFVLEAMKTQQAAAAPFDGVVKSLAISVGDQVEAGQILLLVDA